MSASLLQAPPEAKLDTGSWPGFGLPRPFIVHALKEVLRTRFRLDCSAMRADEAGRWLPLEDGGEDHARMYAFELALPVAGGRPMPRMIAFEIAILLQHYIMRLGGRSFPIAFLPTLDQPALAAAAHAIMQEALRAPR
jgi:hypothetical protein